MAVQKSILPGVVFASLWQFDSQEQLAMSTSTRRPQNRLPPLPPLRSKKSLLALLCATGALIILSGGSMLWLLHGNNNSPSKAAQATPTPTPYPTLAPPTITPPAGALFYDTFVDNSHGWSLASNDGYFRILTDDLLILADTNPDTTLTESVPTVNTNLDNYVISVDFTVHQGDTHDSSGLYLRGDGSLDHDYRVDVNGNNTVDIAKEWLDADQVEQTTMLVSPKHTSYLNPPGKQNTLTVILIGPTITVEINSLVVIMVSDSSYTSGQVALFVHHSKSPSGVTVSYSRVEIDRPAMPWLPPASAPLSEGFRCCAKNVQCVDFREHHLLY